MQPFSKQWLGKHVSAETNKRETIEEPVFYVVRTATVAMQRPGKHASSTIRRLCFLRGSCRGVILKTTGARVELSAQLWSANQWATEGEESPLLRFLTRKCLVKILQRNSHCS
jgi:hypothetical protein